MATNHPAPSEPDFEDSAELPPPVYEVEEQPVERRINQDGKYVQIVDGEEVAIERRRRDND